MKGRRRSRDQDETDKDKDDGGEKGARKMTPCKQTRKEKTTKMWRKKAAVRRRKIKVLQSARKEKEVTEINDKDMEKGIT